METKRQINLRSALNPILCNLFLLLSVRHNHFLNTIPTASGKNYGEDNYESSSYGSSRKSRYSSSKNEEKLTSSNASTNAVSEHVSASAFTITSGVIGYGKPIFKKTAKGINIERKLMMRFIDSILTIDIL